MILVAMQLHLELHIVIENQVYVTFLTMNGM